jgi:hypothetical protein
MVRMNNDSVSVAQVWILSRVIALEFLSGDDLLPILTYIA